MHALYDDFATIHHIIISQFTPHLCHFFHFSETTHPFVNPLHHPPSAMAPSMMSNTNADNNNATGIPLPVWLPTPRPMTDEELAMPMTAAPTNKGASEMGPLETPDSGTAPPSSKKARTTSLSTTIKKSHLKSSNDKIDVEVFDAEVEGVTANEEIKWSLCRPEALGQRVQSAMCHHFKVFHQGIHPDKKGCVACILCFEAKKYDCGTICAKGCNTFGLL